MKSDDDWQFISFLLLVLIIVINSLLTQWMVADVQNSVDKLIKTSDSARP